MRYDIYIYVVRQLRVNHVAGSREYRTAARAMFLMTSIWHEKLGVKENMAAFNKHKSLRMLAI